MYSVVLAGPGRAGLSLALALRAAGHDIAGVVARRPEAAADAAARLDCPPVSWGDALPAADLLIVAVRDDAIASVAAELADSGAPIGSAAHLSGLRPVVDLAPLADGGLATGSLHVLQTLPTPEAGAVRIAGAWVAVTAGGDLADLLTDLARSLGARPFHLADDAKALYHAGAAAAANYPLLALSMAADLFAAAGVPLEAAEPLVRAVVDNAFSLGPRAALTGPVARGDVGTVAAQLAAVRARVPEWGDGFAALAAALADAVGRGEEFAGVLGR